MVSAAQIFDCVSNNIGRDVKTFFFFYLTPCQFLNRWDYFCEPIELFEDVSNKVFRRYLCKLKEFKRMKYMILCEKGMLYDSNMFSGRDDKSL